MAKEKQTDVCQTFCFETERVNNALSTMPSDEILEETQILLLECNKEEGKWLIIAVKGKRKLSKS